MRTESYSEFRNHIRATVNNILYHRGKLKPSVNLADGAPVPEPEQPGGDDGNDSGFNVMEEFMAFMHAKGKGGGKGGGKSWQPRRDQAPGGRPSAPQEGAGNRKCINCGSTAHLTKDCPKAEVPREQRPCWKCGKPGHVGANCPNSTGGARPPRPAGLVEGAEAQPAAPGSVSFFAVEYAKPEDFQPAKHVAKSINRPLPKDLTMDDFLNDNQYAALAESSRLRRMSQKRRKSLCTAIKLVKVSECCSGTCRHSDDISINSDNSPGIEMSHEDKAGSLEVMGIIDYPSDEAAAETSMDTESADKQFINAMQMLSQITADANEKDIEDMANYINDDVPECIVISPEEEDEPPVMDVSDDEDEDEPHLNVHGYVVDQRVVRPKANEESDDDEDPNDQDMNSENQIDKEYSTMNSKYSAVDSKNQSQDLIDLAQNSVDFLENLIDVWKNSELHRNISRDLQEIIDRSKSRLQGHGQARRDNDNGLPRTHATITIFSAGRPARTKRY